MKHYYFKRILTVLFLGIGLSVGWSQDMTVFTYTGAPDTYTVPDGVTSVQVEVWGGEGTPMIVEDYAPSTGGLGGYAIGILEVTPGEVLNIYVGGAGTIDVGGFNGGGLGGFGTPSTGTGGRAGNGGGASDIRQGGSSLADRVIVGGGGGGGGRDYVNGTCVPCGIGGNGGAGGGLTGTDGDDVSWSGILGSFPNVGSGGKGGTPAAGGAAGDGPNGPPGEMGALGIGGNGVNGSQSVASGGGGGGYYGGGSGGGANAGNGVAGGGGAGGSSYIGGVTEGSTMAGIRTGNGEVIITILCNALTITATETEICFGDEITLDAESEEDGTITWDMGVEDEVAFTPAESGTITYTATSDADGDCPGTIDIIVSEAPTVIAGAGDDNFCIDEPVVLSAGGDADEFVWDPTDLEPGLGTHTYMLTGTNETTGCTSTDEVTITVHDLPTVTASADNEAVCIGNSITLTGGGAETYNWDPADIEDGELYEPAAVGTYTYTVIGTDEFGCMNEDDITITVTDEITITYVVTEEMVFEDAEIDITVTGGVAPYTFDWDNDGTGDFDDPEDLTGLADAAYIVVVNGSTGCTATEIIAVGTQASLNELDESLISIYPNPTNDIVTIELEGNFNYELTTINGDIVLKGFATNKEILDLTSFAGGVYFITVNSDNKTATTKVVKK